MKVSELIGRLDLIWQEYGDVDVWYYEARQGYDSGGGPGMSDTGGGSTFDTYMRRLYGAFPATDDYRKDEIRAFVSTSTPAGIQKAFDVQGRYLSSADKLHIKEALND